MEQAESSVEPDVRTRTQYVELFHSVSDACAFETACLSIGDSRPWFADVVVAGLEPTPEYWGWLADSFYAYQIEQFEENEAEERERAEREQEEERERAKWWAKWDEES